jgi:peptide/nickel transport system permease protein
VNPPRNASGAHPQGGAASGPAEPVPRRPLAGNRSHLRHVLAENPVTGIAAALFVFFVLLALLGPALVPFDPLATNAAVALKPPSATHWFGTDALGRDIFSRVVVATRLDLGLALGAVAVSFAIGMPLGLAAGYFGGWWDRIVTRLSDTIMAFPLFVLAMGIVAALGNTVGNIVLATAVINLPFYIRVARAEANVRRSAGWVEAARLSGNSDWRILAHHLFPNALPPAMVQLSLNMGWAILNAAGLSFIGLGVRPPEAEWGILVAEGAQYIVSGEWWVSLFPGAALMLAVFTFNLLGDALRDVFDPRKRT